MANLPVIYWRGYWMPQLARVDSRDGETTRRYRRKKSERMAGNSGLGYMGLEKVVY